MSASRDERGRQKTPDGGSCGQAKAVKLPGTDPMAERSPAGEGGKSAAGLWEGMWEKENLTTALKRVEKNGGAPGIDGMTVKDLRPYLKGQWLEIREALESGRYRPSPVRRVEIPKPDGGVRNLGIPTVLDRLLQQAMLQGLVPVFEPTFSKYSYGFRPGRSTQDALRQAQTYVQEGYEWVVDLDIEKFFDRVNHDMLMARVARVVKDKRVLKLIRAYLEAGVMVNGVVQEMEEGTPQGGPLSPLLSNIMLSDLDRELEQRGHRFVRYADDCNIYVRTERSGGRVLENVRQYVEKKLKLKLNPKKSKVGQAKVLKFLGFSFFERKGVVLIRVARESVKRLKDKLRYLTRRTRNGKLEDLLQEISRYLLGWLGYFRLADTPSVFEELDQWLRRRLRQLIWKRWKRGPTRYRELLKLGVPKWQAGLGAVRHGPWRMAGSPVVKMALSNRYFKDQGLLSIKERYMELRSTHRTAGCGPACPVV